MLELLVGLMSIIPKPATYLSPTAAATAHATLTFVRHGQSVLIAEAVGQSAPAALVRYQGQAVAIGMLTDGHFAPSRVFNLA